MGFKWDSDTYSCAHDSLFTVLLDVMNRNSNCWQDIVKVSNPYIALFDKIFNQVDNKTVEAKRQEIRRN